MVSNSTTGTNFFVALHGAISAKQKYYSIALRKNQDFFRPSNDIFPFFERRENRGEKSSRPAPFLFFRIVRIALRNVLGR